MTDLRCDEGNAVVEFIWLSVLLLVPLVYVVLTAFSVQRAAFAETTAARNAARAYATAGSDAAGELRAESAVAMAMHDQGVRWRPAGRIVDCGACTFAPGSEFVVALRTLVPLPFVPTWMCGHRCAAGITVTARHRERIDCFGGSGPQSSDSGC
jgi:hypothetical protein